jgi:hypothetical protein
MPLIRCFHCKTDTPDNAFRRRADRCVWCQFKDPVVRATWRYRDKLKQEKWPVTITEKQFIAWYTIQPDACTYCGLTFSELKKLRLPRLRGYYVSWDIDRKDSSKPYELGNLALACFYCNTAKANYMSFEEAQVVGTAFRKVYRARLRAQSAA